MIGIKYRADQICYAVLCVFSYFAAGQEQKKAILEQAARVPPAPHLAPPRASHASHSDSELSPKRTSPQKKAILEQTARVPPAPHLSPPRASHASHSDSELSPKRTSPQLSPKRTSPQVGLRKDTKVYATRCFVFLYFVSGPEQKKARQASESTSRASHASHSDSELSPKRTSPQVERKSPVNRAGEARASFAKGEVPTAVEPREPPDRTGPDRPRDEPRPVDAPRDVPDRLRDAPDRLRDAPDGLRDVPDRQPRDAPDRQPRSLPAQPDRPREAPGRETEAEAVEVK
ncbi:titin-like [Ostrinia furnacalis]|uniref:titin-like n=1 Tax=Ostrinia furnacalis TaxID=93504 RepID=UPI0010390E29|nr:titin-like [Ostrinia furnacalis]